MKGVFIYRVWVTLAFHRQPVCLPDGPRRQATWWHAVGRRRLIIQIVIPTNPRRFD